MFQCSTLNIKLNSEVVTSNCGVSTATTTKSTEVTFTVIRHLGDEEEVVTIEVNLQT